MDADCIKQLEILGYKKYSETTGRKKPILSPSKTTSIFLKILNNIDETRCKAACTEIRNAESFTKEQFAKKIPGCWEVLQNFESYNTLIVATSVFADKQTLPIQDLVNRLMNQARYKISPLQTCALLVYNMLIVLQETGKSSLLSQCQKPFESLTGFLQQTFLDSSKSLRDACTKSHETVLYSFLGALKQSSGKECAALESPNLAIERIAKPDLSSNDAQRPKTPLPVVEGVAIAPIVKAIPVSFPVKKVPAKTLPIFEIPDETVFYDGGKLRCPLDSKMILMELKLQANGILDTERKTDEISRLQKYIGKMSTEDEIWSSKSEEICGDNRKWITILTQFTALQLIINRKAALQENSETFVRFVQMLCLGPDLYYEFVPLLQWAAKTGPGYTNGLFTSIFTYAARFFIYRDDVAYDRNGPSDLHLNKPTIPQSKDRDAEFIARAKCFVCMLQRTELSDRYDTFGWIYSYLLGNSASESGVPASFAACRVGQL